MSKRVLVVLRRWLELGLGMDRNGMAAVFLLLLIVVDVSNASFISKFRMLAAANNNLIQKESPSPSPDPVQIDTKTSTNNNKKKSEDSKPNASDKPTPKVVDSKGLKNVADKVGPTPQNQTQNDQTDKEQQEKKPNDETDSQPEERKKDNNEADSQPDEAAGLNCTGVSGRCTDLDSLVACILNFDPGSKQLVVLVQNDGEGFLKVDLSAPNHVDDALIELTKHKSKKVTLAVGYRNEVILRAGHGECVLHVEPHNSQGNFFFNLPSYDKIITPINGAYFVILTVIIFGGSWACCMFKKRRQHGGISYQELEMGMPESGLPNDAETAEGWDQGWDDDWDEENAVKSPAAHRAGNISVNGLTSRAVNKDGWENNWDD